MVATANRGALLALLLSGVFFLYLFRRELGPRGLMRAVIGIPLAFALSAAVVVNFTDFNRLFDRLAESEIEGGLPDTRSVTWPMAWEKIQQRPIAGYGPQLLFREEVYARPGVPEFILWPHNLYLFLWYTIGIVGLVFYLAFFARLYLEYWAARNASTGDAVLDGLPRLGMVIMVVFVIDQMKIEFLRDTATEFQHFIFMLWGAIAAFSVRAMRNRQAISGVTSDDST
jgi:O-antigen ligase